MSFRIQTLLICNGLYVIVLWSLYDHELCPSKPETPEVNSAPNAEVSNTIIIRQVKEKICRGKLNS